MRYQNKIFFRSPAAAFFTLIFPLFIFIVFSLIFGNEYIEELGVKPCRSMEEALDGAHVVVMLRIQQERLEGALFPSVREYSATFGVDREKLRYAKDDAIVMHPGPVNRGVELSNDLADHRPSVILDQVRNGVAIRSAVLYLLLGSGLDLVGGGQ